MFKFIALISCILSSAFVYKFENKTKPLNVLFIPIDDLRPDFTAYGNQSVYSPNLSRLAKNGVVFERAYCQQAVCNPSRASLLTGLRPDDLKVWDLQTNMRAINPSLLTIPQYFRQNGYTTVGLGKTFHNIFPDSLSWSRDIHIDGSPFDPDAIYVSEENLKIIERKKQNFIAENNKSRIDKYGIWYIKANATENANVDDNAYFDAIQASEAINQLRKLKQSDKPFFLSVGFYKPHLPFNAPKKYWDLYDRNKLKITDNQYVPKNSPEFSVHGDQELRNYDDFKDLPFPNKGKLSREKQLELIHGYYACISYIDAQIGRILDELDRLDLAKNTVIVLWGDHGYKLGEHNSWAKQSNYEIDTNVPLIVSGANVKSKGKTSKSLVEFVDIFPSLCELTGLKIPNNLSGKSFVPTLKNTSKTIKDAAYSQFLLGRFPKNSTNPERMGYAIRTEKYRYVEWYDWKNDKPNGFLSRELFDHSKDPKENENIASSNSEICNSLSKKLHKNFRTLGI